MRGGCRACAEPCKWVRLPAVLHTSNGIPSANPLAFPRDRLAGTQSIISPKRTDRCREFECHPSGPCPTEGTNQLRVTAPTTKKPIPTNRIQYLRRMPMARRDKIQHGLIQH